MRRWRPRGRLQRCCAVGRRARRPRCAARRWRVRAGWWTRTPAPADWQRGCEHCALRTPVETLNCRGAVAYGSSLFPSTAGGCVSSASGSDWCVCVWCVPCSHLEPVETCSAISRGVVATVALPLDDEIALAWPPADEYSTAPATTQNVPATQYMSLDSSCVFPSVACGGSGPREGGRLRELGATRHGEPVDAEGERAATGRRGDPSPSRFAARPRARAYRRVAPINSALPSSQQCAAAHLRRGGVGVAAGANAAGGERGGAEHCGARASP